MHSLVVDSMKSVLKIDGGDASKEVEEEPEKIENNFLARGKSYCVTSSVIQALVVQMLWIALSTG